MRSIQNIVEELIEKNPLLEESMTLGIANLNAVSSILEPEIRKATNKQFTKQAITMALSRASQRFKDEARTKKISINNPSGFILRSGLVGFKIKKTKEIEERIVRIKKEMEIDINEAFFIIQTEKEIMVYVSGRLGYALKNSLSQKESREEKKNLASISMDYNKKESHTPLLVVLRSMLWKNIEIENLMYSDSEIVLILKEDDATRAYEAIKALGDKKIRQ